MEPKDEDENDHLILTAAHLFLESGPPRFVLAAPATPAGLQPADNDGRACGELRRMVPLVVQPYVAVDAAVIKPHHYVEWDNRINGRAARDLCDLWAEAPEADVRVMKQGAATGLTRGTLTPIAADHVMDAVDRRYTSGWWVDGEGGDFAGQGDSGAVVLDDEHRLVGMAVAVKSPDGSGPTFVHGARQIFSALRIGLLDLEEHRP